MKKTFIDWEMLAANWMMEHGFKICIIIVGAYVANKILKRFIIKTVRIVVVPDKSLPPETEIKREDTLIRIFGWSTRILIISLCLLMILQEIGVPIGPILAGAGIVGLAFGFGGQYLIRDLITGFFIILENQYRIGDSVKFDSASGIVEDISLRMTTLRDLDGTVHHVPHGEVKQVSNLSKDFARVNINIGVSYSAKIDHVISVVNKVGNELAEDPAWKEKIIKAPQFLRVDDFADSSVVIKILGDTQALKQFEVAGELRKRIKAAFDEEKIEIPFPQRDIHVKGTNKLT